MDHGTGTSTTSMYLSNMVPTQTPAKTIQTSVLRRTGTGARDSGSIKYKYIYSGIVRGPSEYRTFSVSIGPSHKHNKRAVTSPPVDFFAIGLRIRNPRGKPVLKTF